MNDESLLHIQSTKENDCDAPLSVRNDVHPGSLFKSSLGDSRPRLTLADTQHRWLLAKFISLMLISALLFSILSVLIKYGSDYGYSSSELLMIRGIIQTIIVTVALLYNCWLKKTKANHEYRTISINSSSFDRSTQVWLILRGLFGAGGSGILYFYSVTMIPIGDATATYSLYPVLTSFVAYIILKERVTKSHAIALITAITGVILQCQPSFLFDFVNKNTNKQEYHESGYYTAIGAAIVGSFSFVSMRKLKDVDKNYLILSYSLSCIILGLIFCYVLHPTGIKIPQYDKKSERKFITELCILIAMGIVGYMGNVTMTVSAQRIQSSLSSLLRSTSSLYSYVFQVLLFAVIPTPVTAIGAVLIVASVLLVSFATYLHK